jgi:hypothetical protein
VGWGPEEEAGAKNWWSENCYAYNFRMARVTANFLSLIFGTAMLAGCAQIGAAVA